MIRTDIPVHVDNGQPVTVQVGSWRGVGAYRREKGVLQLVYLGGPAPAGFPASIKVDDQTVEVTDKLRAREAAPFTVLIVKES